jgi:hypothetical protein
MRIAFCNSPLGTIKESYAKVVQTKIIPEETLYGYMTETSKLKLSGIHEVFEEFEKALLYHLPSGDSVQTSIGTFSLRPYYPQLSEEEKKDPLTRRSVDKGEMAIRFRPSKSFLDRARATCSIQIVDAPALQIPVINILYNIEGGEGLEAAKAGQLFALKGSRLSFGKDDEETGVFFLGGSGAQSVRASVYGSIGNTKVIFKLPDLVAGVYGVEIRTRPTDKDVRVGGYDGTLTIVS